MTSEEIDLTVRADSRVDLSLRSTIPTTTATATPSQTLQVATSRIAITISTGEAV